MDEVAAAAVATHPIDITTVAIAAAEGHHMKQRLTIVRQCRQHRLDHRIVTVAIADTHHHLRHRLTVGIKNLTKVVATRMTMIPKYFWCFLLKKIGKVYYHFHIAIVTTTTTTILQFVYYIYE